MGGIDYDPASCARANEIVRARAFTFAPGPTLVVAGQLASSPTGGGLDVPWSSLEGQPSKVFLNPPGGKLHPKTLEPMPENGGPGLSAAAVWWWKLIDEYRAGNVEQAIFVAFTLNVFQNSQQFEYPAPYEFPFVVPAQRLRFWNERVLIGKGQPQHCNAVVYLPPRDAAPPNYLGTSPLDRFREAFAPFGAVRL